MSNIDQFEGNDIEMMEHDAHPVWFTAKNFVAEHKGSIAAGIATLVIIGLILFPH
jgi:hypothetical protein